MLKPVGGGGYIRHLNIRGFQLLGDFLVEEGSEHGFKGFVFKHEADRGLFGFINLIGVVSLGVMTAPAMAEYVSGIIESEIKG